ncbi:MAG: TrmH family RNA methyltransferase [Geminicoccaceae bacterium]|nr:TrmH family RNA methyltransferase [Geminicoccaceae bacterium]
MHRARRDPAMVVLEGLHAVKHALRFGVVPRLVISDAPASVLALAAELAPDVQARLAALLEPVTTAEFAALAPEPPATRLIAVADRPVWPGSSTAAGPIVVLDRPRHPGNLGAVVRVAAAAGAAAVWTLGGVDPWSAAAIRGSAGLHMALPVEAPDELPPTGRPIIALADGGEPLGPGTLPGDAVLLFGSERDGLAPHLRRVASRIVTIPMRPGVSSLNLATAVAVVLYLQRLAGSGASGPADTGQPDPLST